jgi:O-methyltransferase
MSSNYINLLKHTLAFQLWPEPVRSLLDFQECNRELQVQMEALARNSGLSPTQLCIGLRPNVTEEDRRTGTFWPLVADTMVGMLRLDNVEDCVNRVLDDNIPGDFIECGIWRGGVGMLMRALLLDRGVVDRTVFLADSFQGLPEPDEEKFPLDKGDTHHKFRELAVSLEEVQSRFKRYGLLDAQVQFLKGWFRDTLPSAPIEKLAILRLDGDMYGSTVEIFHSLYHKLSPGGFCIVDDYSLPACKQAVLDFRREKGITEEIIPIDFTGVFWRKERKEHVS